MSALTDSSVWLDRQMENNPHYAESGEGAFLISLIRERNRELKQRSDRIQVPTIESSDGEGGGT